MSKYGWMVVAACAVSAPSCRVHVYEEPPPRHEVYVERRAPATEVVVVEEPPPVRVEVRPACPSPNHVWVSGYWWWNGRTHVWIAGAWHPRPRPTAVWVEGRWERRGNGHVWIAGYWRG